MTRIIYFFVNVITKFHTKFLALNDNSGLALTDKQLHFLIVGLFGFGMLLVIQPVFDWLSKHDGVLLITFTYVFSAIIVVTFAIEIGQGFTGTGEMDFKDIVSGIFGFFVFFAIYLIGYIIFRRIKEIRNSKNNQK